MKSLLLVPTLVLTLALTLIFAPALADQAAKEVSGTITMSKETKIHFKKGGSMFIFLKKHTQRRGRPMAVLRVEKPTFPYKFSIGEKNVIQMGGAKEEFKGEFWIAARYTLSGNAMGGPDALYGEVIKKEGITLGTSNIEIKLTKGQ